VFGEPLPSTQFVAIPIFTSAQHTTLFLLEKKGEAWAVEFFDSKALPLPHPQNWNALAVYNQFSSVGEQLQAPLQVDQHNSGTFACWFLEERLKGTPFKEIKVPSYSIEYYRFDLGKRIASDR
ncbi:MAG: hypothetical protein ACRENF_08090, partial [Thermodesulfobacteriota bacterium]